MPLQSANALWGTGTGPGLAGLSASSNWQSSAWFRPTFASWTSTPPQGPHRLWKSHARPSPCPDALTCLRCDDASLGEVPGNLPTPPGDQVEITFPPSYIAYAAKARPPPKLSTNNFSTQNSISGRGLTLPGQTLSKQPMSGSPCTGEHRRETRAGRPKRIIKLAIAGLIQADFRQFDKHASAGSPARPSLRFARAGSVLATSGSC